MIHQERIDSVFDPLDLHASNPARYPHILQSTATGSQGRYDILFAFPRESLVLHDVQSFDFLEALDDAWRAEAGAAAAITTLPFHGGWFLYLGYELAGQIEPHLQLKADDSGLPVACATRFPAAVIVDRLTDERWIVSENPELPAQIADDITRLRSPVDTHAPQYSDVREDPDSFYLQAVNRTLGYIRDGDVFQVNLSRQWCAEWPSDIRTDIIYRRLRASNPAPFSGLATWGDRAILCSSPERLVEVRGEQVQTRPIAGTRPRGTEQADDEAFSDELLAHPKERAEHIMLIDLERNDLGRIAVPGSVAVNELMVLESYTTVHHIVSNVQAIKRPDVTPGDVIRAVFPGGTITGCPKVRCMEIIAEMELCGRGAYTGSMGYLNRDGSMDLNILIRSMIRSGARLSFRAGAGIVTDSVPEAELEETRAKARGMLRALQDGAEP
ncbi:MAG: aminodeoxychorismate synthase component I [Thiogranum sp.]|nr:aminodeoxychorismate synthase component I [Thiogranum sp.]